MKLRFTLLLLFFVGIGYSQVTNEGKPYSWKLQDNEEVMPIEMPGFDLKALQDEDLANAGKKDMPWRFGYEFIVDHNLNNSGKWTDLPNGDRVWRIRYKSDGAKTMNFLFSDFYMPEGAKVYLYNNDRSDLLGAYDSQQNNDERVLGTWLVTGEDIWIEYFEPADKAGQGKLEIFKVVHGYRTVTFSTNKDAGDGLNTSGNCNYDVNCPIPAIDNLKNVNKKAVALIIANNSSFCTGALINNTNNDGTPYFLTANHCYSNPSQWAFRFNWISPNPVCSGSANSTQNNNYYQTVSGATLKARREQSDFCLVQITANMPSSWDLIWAGWNRSETAPSSTFGIHHPSGDIMKVCRDLNPPTLDNSGGENVWVVNDWDLGVTEGGSSGSPLFDNNGRIIGQLWGGAADCVGNNDNGLWDEYGRFGVSWGAGSSAGSRLRDWLDPTNSNQMILNPYPPQQVLALNAKVSIEDVNQSQCSSFVTPVIKLTNAGSQTLTSAVITYSVNGGTPSVYNWTGSLVTNASANVSLPAIQTAANENVLNVVVSAPNNGTDGFPGDNIANREFSVLVYDEVSDVILILNTDAFGYETSWTLTNQNGTVLYNGSGYGGNQMYFATFNLTEAGCYTFTINDTQGDGICCTSGNGSYELLINGNTMAMGGSFGSTQSVSFRLGGELSTEDYLKSSLKIYPNPSSGVFTVAGSESAVTYTLYNVLGQQIKSGKLDAGNTTLDISGSANGVYILSVEEAGTGAKANYKLIKE